MLQCGSTSVLTINVEHSGNLQTPCCGISSLAEENHPKRCRQPRCAQRCSWRCSPSTTGRLPCLLQTARRGPAPLSFPLTSTTRSKPRLPCPVLLLPQLFPAAAGASPAASARRRAALARENKPDCQAASSWQYLGPGLGFFFRRLL